MIPRNLQLPDADSFFLFGARGVGKSTLVRSQFPDALVIDLLSPATEREFQLNVGHLTSQLHALQKLNTLPHTVVIDEIQKVPKLLDEVHAIMESKSVSVRFVLTGSSARKLKAGGANLLAGRAVVRSLFPFVANELDPSFDLQKALTWGTLPLAWFADNDGVRRDRLESYALTYLREEVWGEQLVRKLEPFRRFLEVSAQSNGKTINLASIARDVGADPKTVQSYFEILEDTLLGFHVDAFHTSVRKRLRQAPKFYFFDLGVARALSRQLRVGMEESTSAYGDAFECFFVNELHRRNVYEQRDYRLSHFRTPAGVEVDLVVDRPGRPPALIEVKSTRTARADHATALAHVARDLAPAEAFLVTRDPVPKQFGSVLAVPWELALGAI
jgi:predicted AAA+ superfamily ATPase